MLNLQGLFAVLSVFSLLIVLVGLALFGIDLWSFSHTSLAAHVKLNYRGLGIVLCGLFWFAAFLISFFVMEIRFRKRIDKRKAK
jgi:hypothetical protein